MENTPEKDMFWAAASHWEGMPPWQSRIETQEFLATGDGWPSCIGYCGELKLDGKWHSVWQFDDRQKAEEFCSKERVFTYAEMLDFAAKGLAVYNNPEEYEDEAEPREETVS